MARVALLPFCGDPMLLQFWMKMFSRWEREVDKLMIHLNNDIPSVVREFIVSYLSSYREVELIESSYMSGHGESLALMLDKCKDEDVVMFVEEDGFVFQHGKVDKCFK